MEQLNAIPWYRSRIIVGVAVSLVTKVLLVSGLVNDVTSAQEEGIVNAVLMLAGGPGHLWALYSRTQQKAAPVIAATKSSALDKHVEIEGAKVAAAIDAGTFTYEIAEDQSPMSNQQISQLIDQVQAAAQETRA